MLAYKIASCEVCINWRKLVGACKIQCQSPSRRLIELRWSHQEIKVDCFMVHGGTLSTCIKESIHVGCPVECGAFTGDGLTKYGSGHETAAVLLPGFAIN